MDKLIQYSTVALVLAVSLICFAGVMQAEQATAANVTSVILSIHGMH